jgi:2-methylcitrate dehydratase PrpD
MTAIGLLNGSLTAADYEDNVAGDPRIDALRSKMQCVENPAYTQDYLDPEKRSIANAIQIFFKDSSHSKQIAVEYPIGHRRRREEGIPELVKKFKVNLARRFPERQQNTILDSCMNEAVLSAMPVRQFVDMLVI